MPLSENRRTEISVPQAKTSVDMAKLAEQLGNIEIDVRRPLTGGMIGAEIDAAWAPQQQLLASQYSDYIGALDSAQRQEIDLMNAATQSRMVNAQYAPKVDNRIESTFYDAQSGRVVKGYITKDQHDINSQRNLNHTEDSYTTFNKLLDTSKKAGLNTNPADLSSWARLDRDTVDKAARAEFASLWNTGGVIAQKDEEAFVAQRIAEAMARISPAYYKDLGYISHAGNLVHGANTGATGYIGD